MPVPPEWIYLWTGLTLDAPADGMGLTHDVPGSPLCLLLNTLKATTTSTFASLESLPTNTVECLAVCLRTLEDVSSRSSLTRDSIANVHRIAAVDLCDCGTLQLVH
jgi:hypothetical protein